ncbi:MAG: TolC family protein [Candidatus Omnitrophica bacterium]|nr:TolC family protein [Candidatus Omnitrophota bacterium]
MNKAKNIFLIALLFCLFTQAAHAEEMLTWEDCVKEAQKNNPDLISALESIKQEMAAKDITASALFPQASGTVSASKAEASTATSSSKSDAYSYGASGSQLIFDGFKTINDTKAASENVKAAKEAYRFTSFQVRFNLRSAFVNLLTAQELMRVAEEIVKIRRDNLMLITLQYMSGLEHRGALLTAEANMAQANFGLSQAKRSIEYAQVQLLKEMGREQFSQVLAEGDFTVKDCPKDKPDFIALIADNPSILQADFKKNAASYDIKSAYGNFSPELSGTGALSKNSSQWPPRNNQWNMGVSLSMPIFEGGLRTAQLKKARAAYNQAEADEKSTRDAAIVSLEQTWIKLQDAMDMVGVQNKTLLAAQERSNIAKAQYSTGFINFDNWIIIENDLVSAKKAYLESQFDALSAEASWVQAKGETLEYAQ